MNKKQIILLSLGLFYATVNFAVTNNYSDTKKEESTLHLVLRMRGSDVKETEDCKSRDLICQPRGKPGALRWERLGRFMLSDGVRISEPSDASSGRCFRFVDRLLSRCFIQVKRDVDLKGELGELLFLSHDATGDFVTVVFQRGMLICLDLGRKCLIKKVTFYGDSSGPTVVDVSSCKRLAVVGFKLGQPQIFELAGSGCDGDETERIIFESDESLLAPDAAQGDGFMGWLSGAASGFSDLFTSCFRRPGR